MLSLQQNFPRAVPMLSLKEQTSQLCRPWFLGLGHSRLEVVRDPFTAPAPGRSLEELLIKSDPRSAGVMFHLSNIKMFINKKLSLSN